MSLAQRVLLAIACAAGALGCQSHEHPPPLLLAASGSAGRDGSDGGLLVGEGGSQQVLCGDQEIPAIKAPPNLYFVIDRSGSMGDELPGSAFSKYENARIAISVMLRAVGHRVNYGAAVFPAFVNQDGCAPGIEIFPTRPGDPPNYAAKGENGPVLSDLLTRLGSNEPGGGTPTAASLLELEKTVFSLEGKKTYLVLMTDGAPNCNESLNCGGAACIPNIEHAVSPQGTLCDDSFNCCAPKVAGGGQCVDADATEQAVQAYEAAGIDTYVVGMPGSEAYRTMLGRLAQAGNTARPGSTPYYAVTDTAELSQALRSIGAQVALSCDLPLSEMPAEADLVNVYFDGRVVPNSNEEGWHFASASRIQFRGDACSELSSGDVLSVQVLSGCPTVLR